MKRFIVFFNLKEMKLPKFFLVVFLIETVVVFFFAPAFVAWLISLASLFFLVWLVLSAQSLAKINFALRMGENQNLSIVNSLSEGVIAYDQDFNIWSMNDAAEIICSIRKEDVLNKKVSPDWANNDKLKVIASVVFPSLAPTLIKKTVATYPQVVDISFTAKLEKELDLERIF